MRIKSSFEQFNAYIIFFKKSHSCTKNVIVQEIYQHALLNISIMLDHFTWRRVSEVVCCTSFNNTSDSFWLRDHCKCPTCYHSVTKQRLVDTYAIPIGLKIQSAALDPSGKKLNVFFGDHSSVFDVDWLFKKETTKLTHIHWNSLFKIPISSYEEVMTTEQGVKEWLQNIVLNSIVKLSQSTYGIGIVEGCPATPAHTGELARRISLIRNSHYGEVWDFTSDLSHGDTAYTNLALQAHTDTTYFTDPVGFLNFIKLILDYKYFIS